MDFDGEKLILKIPSFPHEVLHKIFFQNQNSVLCQLVEPTGSADIDLFGKTQSKSPDLSFGETKKEKGDSDRQADHDDDVDSSPTVVVEVGFSETLKKMNFDAARLLLGNYIIQLVINIKIMAEGDNLKWVTVDLWYSKRTKKPEG